MLFRMTRGDFRQIAGKITDPSGTPYNLSLYNLWFTAKRKISDADTAAVIRRSTDPQIGGISLVDPAAGTFIISIPSSATANLSDVRETELLYDLQIRNANNEVQTLSKGRLIVDFDITRAS